MAVVGTFMMGCAVLLFVGCAGVRSEAPEEEQGHTEGTREQEQERSPEATASEEARCEGTRTIVTLAWGSVVTNDVPGCPRGGLLSGTDKPDKLSGEDGEDEVRGLGGSDNLWGGFGRDAMYGGRGDDELAGSTVGEDGHDESKDIIHGGPGRDWVFGMRGDDVLHGGGGDDKTFYAKKVKDDLYGGLDGGGGEDVLFGGDGNDLLDGSLDGQRDELYCGKGTDEYAADKIDYVSSSCEVKTIMARA